MPCRTRNQPGATQIQAIDGMKSEQRFEARLVAHGSLQSDSAVHSVIAFQYLDIPVIGFCRGWACCFVGLLVSPLSDAPSRSLLFGPSHSLSLLLPHAPTLSLSLPLACSLTLHLAPSSFVSLSHSFHLAPSLSLPHAPILSLRSHSLLSSRFFSFPLASTLSHSLPPSSLPLSSSTRPHKTAVSTCLMLPVLPILPSDGRPLIHRRRL